MAISSNLVAKMGGTVHVEGHDLYIRYESREEHQYEIPSSARLTPQAFDAYAAIARAKGFLLVAASPLTRSSYHAGDDFKKMQQTRAEQLARSTAGAGDNATA